MNIVPVAKKLLLSFTNDLVQITIITFNTLPRHLSQDVNS